MRIASLLASATEIVCRLGLADRLVAISHECDHPPEILDRPRISRPRFDPSGRTGAEIDAAVREALATHGSVYEIDVDVLREVSPDLLLTQDVCEVCAVPTALAQQAAEVLGRPTRVLSLDAHSIEDIMETIHRVADATATVERGRAVVEALRADLAEIHGRVRGGTRPRVLALEWLDPAFVPGHWGPEMIDAAGGMCLVGSARGRSRQVDWEELADLNPDVLLLLPCGYDLDHARREADRAADRLRAVAGAAIASGRTFVVDGSAYFNRSGPRVVEGVALLARLFHPERFPDVPLAGRAAVWEPPAAARPD